MGQVACKCGDIDIIFPWPTFAALAAAFALIIAGLVPAFEKGGSPNGWLIIPAFLLVGGVFAFQIWASTNGYTDPHDVNARTLDRLPADVTVVEPARRTLPAQSLAHPGHYAVQYVTAAGVSLPVVGVVDGVPVVGCGERLVAV
jgi:hypothetical protein